MPANPKYSIVDGFGLLGVIILVAVIASAALGGGMYWNEAKKQQSLLQTGTDAIKRAEELKKQIESRDVSIYGGRTSINSIPLYFGLEWGPPKKEFDPYRGNWSGNVVYSSETRSDIESQFFKFYDSELKLRGWQKNLFDADSPRGSISGYMREDGHLFLGVKRKSLSTISEGPFMCPCEYIYSIWSDTNVSFINQIDTSTWKTYRNEKYGFEVRYPENWKFEIIPDYDEKGEIVPDAQAFFFTSDDLHRVIIAPHGSNLPGHNDSLYGWKEIFSSQKYARFTISILPINARQVIDQEKIPLLKTIVSTFKFIN